MKADINVTPLIDVLLVLLIIFMLVTPVALRALGEAVAVPQTGPLPGAYTKSMLPELEARVARGEWSLRGVNPTVLGLDPALLTDVDTAAELAALAAVDELAHNRHT